MIKIPSRFRAGLETAVWIVLLVVVGVRMWPQAAAALGVESQRRDAPDFTLTTLAGDVASRESLRGRVVLVNFWATWCPPCRVEMPGFQDVYAARKHDGFTIVGISTDVTTDRVRDFIAEREITYPIAMASGAVTSAFGDPRTLPTSFLIDRAGRIRYEVRGIFTETALSQAVDRLLAEPAPASSRADQPAGGPR